MMDLYALGSGEGSNGADESPQKYQQGGGEVEVQTSSSIDKALWVLQRNREGVFGILRRRAK